MNNSKEYLIYFNLHNHLWSIKDVRPVVSEQGRQRVIEEKRKNVHAYLRGKIVSLGNFQSYKGRRKPREETCRNFALDWLEETRMITYNPYQRGDFYYKDNSKTFESADRVYLLPERRVFTA